MWVTLNQKIRLIFASREFGTSRASEVLCVTFLYNSSKGRERESGCCSVDYKKFEVRLSEFAEQKAIFISELSLAR